MNCRICGAPAVTVAGHVEYYAGYSRDVYDCPACLCRFTKHDNAVYDQLHSSGAVSYYNDYRDLAARCKLFFDQKDVAGLGRLLRQTSKYQFVIDQLEGTPPDARLLEIGCSRGYLTSWFILGGRDVVGTDVSTAALDGAKRAFGERYFLSTPEAIDARAPYEIVYHVGVIGCVEDPVGLTRQLLARLKPGGRLLFNAPNLRSCYLRGQLWLDSAPPPDVVTLFSPGFWSRQFADLADVCERQELWHAEKGLAIGLRKLFRRRWKKPELSSFSGPGRETSPRPRHWERIWDAFERAAVKGGRLTGLSRFAAGQPSEFGLFVEMTKKQCGP